MSWKGILGKAGVSLTGLNGANNWTFEGTVHARNIISRFAGQHFHVDNGCAAAKNSAKYGKRKEKPFATIEYAVSQCTANDGDVIWAHAGHVEAVVAAGGLDLDVEGITIVFMGNGNDQAKITFGTDVDADMDINADNITLINPRFESAIDALTGPIDINKTNFTIIKGEYYDAAGKAATDCIVAVATATGLTIDGWRYIESTTGTQKQSNIQLNGVDDAILKDIDIRGDFGTGNIENVVDEVLNIHLRDIYINNLNSGPVPGIVLDSNADGFAKNVNVRIASGTTFVSDVADLNWSSDCLGFNTDGEGGDPIGVAASGGIEGKIDIIDGLHDVPVADAVTNLYMRDVVGIKTDAAAAGAVSAEESLMAYAKQAVTEGIARDAAIVILDEFHDVPAADNVLNAQVNEVIGNKADVRATGSVSETDTIIAYIKQLIEHVRKLDRVTLTADPVAASLASFIASGGTSLGTQLPASFSLLDMVRGKKVSRGAADVFDGTQTPLFTVAGGRVCITCLMGEVSGAAIDVGASNTSLVTNPTVGTDAAMCTVLDIDSDENGTIYAVTGNPSSALQGGSGGGSSCMDRCFIVPEGTIDLLSAADAGTGGALGAFDIWYIPIDTGATIVAT